MMANKDHGTDELGEIIRNSIKILTYIREVIPELHLAYRPMT